MDSEQYELMAYVIVPLLIGIIGLAWKAYQWVTN